jgi:adenine-specific DNA-methyltransferase
MSSATIARMTDDASSDNSRLLATTTPRALGAYYTPPAAASVLAGWVVESGARTVLEPSMGDGVFLAAVAQAAAAGGRRIESWGVELAADTFAATVAAGPLEPGRAIRGDFLGLEPFPVDAVIGNPPFVRLRHVPPAEARRAARAAAAVLGAPMDPSGSSWMPFVLHASRFLRPGGSLAFVLPYELTYVRYARPLWRFLADSFARLRLVRVRERLFPEIMQDVVLLFAAGSGGTTGAIEFEAYDRVRDLDLGRPDRTASIPVELVVVGRRPFVEALLPPALQAVLAGRLAGATVPASELVRFNVGYVTGDKGFFHPREAVVRRFRLPASRLLPSLTSSRQLRGAGVRTSGLPPAATGHRLYLPDATALAPGERAYLAEGEATGIAGRYKCRVREPWFVTPGVRTPAVVLPVFADAPVLLENDAGYVASNSLLCGYLQPGLTAGSLLARWYTSLTLLQIELEVHALGGGVRVFVPSEAGAVRLAARVVESGRLTARTDALVRAGEIARAYELGDEPVLIRQLRLSPAEIELIREGTTILGRWRNGSRAGRPLGLAA